MLDTLKTKGIPPIFVYEKELRSFEFTIQRNFYIQGGRGIGKTTFLAKLIGEISPNEYEIKLLSGHKYIEASSYFRDGDHDLSKLKYFFFDDLDVFCQKGMRREESNFERIIEKMDYLFNEKMASKKIHIIVTGSSTPQNMCSPKNHKYGEKYHSAPAFLSDFWSNLELTWENLELSPWHYGWKDNLNDIIEEVFSHHEIRPNLLKIWKKSIIKMTGGHPSLLEPAVSELKRLCVTPYENLPPLEKKLLELEAGSDSELALIDQHLENNLVNTGIKYIRRALSNIVDVNHPDYQNAFEYLKKLARGEKEIEIPYNLREILFEEALCYQNKDTGQYELPGVLVEKEILRHCDISLTIPITFVEANRQTPDQSGYFIAKFDNEERRVRLFGGPWKILNFLLDKANKVITLDEIGKNTKLKTESAVRSAIQRLDNKLKESGLSIAIENVRGEGYRLNIPEEIDVVGRR